MYSNSEELEKQTQRMLENLNLMQDCLCHSDSDNTNTNSDQIEEYEVIQARNFFEKFLSTLSRPSFLAGKNRVLLLTGPAGSGKSHLLCDFTRKQMERGQPVVLLLGQNYPGGDPTKFIYNGLHLHSNDSDLQLLELYGAQSSRRVVIIIDAVNEGEHSSDWKNNLLALRQIITENPHLCLVISCRSTYLNQIIGDTIKSKFPTVNHPGFSGNKSKAARKYLEKFGIQAPDVPFLSEELTNPLFLRTICSAMKSQNQCVFSFKSDGLDKLLSFYQSSIENNIANKLNLRSTAIIRNAIKCFTTLLFPDQLFGISYVKVLDVFQEKLFGHAEEILNSLITEGLLSESPSLNKDGDNIVNFSFERFSDLYNAQLLLVEYDTISKFQKALLPENKVGQFLLKNSPGNGIIEVLSVLIPERFNCELVDLIDWNHPEFISCYLDKQRLIDSAFAYSLTVRSSNAFSERTNTLFNQISTPSFTYQDDRFDILIRLSLQVENPWNATKLDAVLRRLDSATRDALWSTHIAVSDYGEDADLSASPIRTLVEWASEVDVCDLSGDSQKLLGTVLLWLTTTTNLKSRERTERALARLFALAPAQITYFIDSFSDIDDQYLVESLYSSIYAAILRQSNLLLLKQIAKSIPWARLIENVPDILIRDSLTGIFEYGKSLSVPALPEEMFPIHKHPSLKPLIFPNKQNIDEIREQCSEIARSAGSEFGDFGKYTMSMINLWSSTSLQDASGPQTEREKSEIFFAKQSPEVTELFDEIKALDLRKSLIDEQAASRYLENNSTNDYSFYFKNLKNSNEKKEIETIDFRLEQLQNEIREKISPAESNRTDLLLQSRNSDSISKFDKSAAQRWVVKHAYEMGWKKELFSGFEEMYCNEFRPPYQHNIERIGKKYERIALAQLLAYISEQYYFVPQNYDDVDDSVYKGIWQFNYRKIDLTFPPLITSNSTKKLPQLTEYQYNSLPPMSLHDQQEWVQSNTTIPNFSKIIEINDQASNNSWLLLADFQSVSDKPEDRDSELLQSDFWYRINSCIIKTSDLKDLIVPGENASLMAPDLIYIPNNMHQAYFSEYPYRNLYPELITQPQTFENKSMSKVTYESLLREYSWEYSDQATETQAYQPSRKLIQDLNLTYGEYGEWKSDYQVVFCDPHLWEQGRSRALCSKKALANYLKENNLSLIWLIGGEKRLFNPRKYLLSRSKLNYSEFSAFYYLDEFGAIKGTQNSNIDETN